MNCTFIPFKTSARTIKYLSFSRLSPRLWQVNFFPDIFQRTFLLSPAYRIPSSPFIYEVYFGLTSFIHYNHNHCHLHSRWKTNQTWSFLSAIETQIRIDTMIVIWRTGVIKSCPFSIPVYQIFALYNGAPDRILSPPYFPDIKGAYYKNNTISAFSSLPACPFGFIWTCIRLKCKFYRWCPSWNLSCQS